MARPEGPVWFVAGAVPGELVLARPHRVRRRFVEATVERLVEASTSRRPAACPVQDRCGGCPWMVLDEPTQRRWKSRLIEEAIRRIAGIPTIPIESVVSSGRSLAYRNKVEFTLGLDGVGQLVVGLHAAGEATLVDVDRCVVQSELGNRVLASCRELLLAPDARAELEPVCGRGSGFRLVIRTSEATGEALLAVVETLLPFPKGVPLASFVMDRHPEVRGVVRVRARSGQRGGARTEVVAGRAWISEQVGGTLYRLPAASFLQINADMAGELIRLVGECAGNVRGEKVFDLYGGVGSYGAELARRGATCTTCDADVEAIRCGRQAARHAGLDGVRFVHSDVLRFLRQGLEAGRSADVVVANPPRAGFGPGVAQALGSYRPRRVVVVSCDPATLARDLKELLGRGYRLERVIPVDLFPQSAQVEVVASLVGQGPG